MIEELETMIMEYRELQQKLASEEDQGFMYAIEMDMESKEKEIRDYCKSIGQLPQSDAVA